METYGLSIITSNVRQINLSYENIKDKHWCFQISKIVSQKIHFDILIYILFKNIYLIYISDYWEKQKTKNNNFQIDVSVFDVVKRIRLCYPVHHKCGDANRGTEIICIAFVASIFCYSKRSSTIQQSLQYVKGNLAYRNFRFF